MNAEFIRNARKDIMSIGVLLWEKELVTGLNGNISVRVDSEHILLTATKTCLGLLKDKDILLMNLKGEVLDQGQVSNEKLMHIEIYKAFPDVKAVLHTHTPFANGYFLENEILYPRIFETKMYLGEIRAVDQQLPSVQHAEPVIEALKQNSIVVLRKHGVVAVGKDLFDCFLLVQYLEDAVKVDAVSRLYRAQEHKSTRAQDGSLGDRVTGREQPAGTSHQPPATSHLKKFKLFSQEQIDEIVRLVNGDQQLSDLGAKTQMTMDLAVQMNETGEIYSFHFENGKIARVGHDANAEFLISAPRDVWRAVFNREIDPFVATTQKRMNLKGDFARISRWYAPCSRIFELWQEVPVE